MNRSISRPTQQRTRRIPLHKRGLKLQQVARATRSKRKAMYLTGSHQKDCVIRDRIRNKINLVIPLPLLQHQYIIKVMTMKILDPFLPLRYFAQITNAKVGSQLRG